MIEKIRHCLRADRFLFSKHARDEMEAEEYGEIKEHEVYQALLDGKIIEEYPEDEPYPSYLVYGRTTARRPLHILCAYSGDDDLVVIVTVYQPDPKKWIDFESHEVIPSGEENMKCIICRGSDIVKKSVEEEMRVETDILLIPIEVLVCRNCGERYYDRKTMQALEEVRSQLREKKLEVEDVGKVLRAKVA